MYPQHSELCTPVALVRGASPAGSPSWGKFHPENYREHGARKGFFFTHENSPEANPLPIGGLDHPLTSVASSMACAKGQSRCVFATTPGGLSGPWMRVPPADLRSEAGGQCRRRHLRGTPWKVRGCPLCPTGRTHARTQRYVRIGERRPAPRAAPRTTETPGLPHEYPPPLGTQPPRVGTKGGRYRGGWVPREGGT